MSKKYKYYIDPSHGWLKVTRRELVSLGILSKITSYSYSSPSGKWVYLEEDLDMGEFISAVAPREEKQWYSENVEVVSTDQSSHIRTYDPYQPTQGER